MENHQTIFIALLRGINVGGKNKIKPADLKQMFLDMGFGKVQTYIQSGNILFESDEPEEVLCKRIEQQIKLIFGFPVVVILRTVKELEEIIQACPFSEEEIAAAESSSGVESLYIAMSNKEPAPKDIERFMACNNHRDKCYISRRNVYLLFSKSIRKSKLANNLLKLNVLFTVRNRKTMNKLFDLAKLS